MDASVDDGANVQIWHDNGSLAQKWYVKRASGKVNTYTLQAACSGKQLAADSNGNAVQRTADGSSEQLWRADFSGGFVVFTNLGTGRVLELCGWVHRRGYQCANLCGERDGCPAILATRDAASA